MTEYNWSRNTLESTCNAVLQIIDVFIERINMHADMADKSFNEHNNLADFIMRDKTEYCIEVLKLLKDAIIQLKGGEVSND